MDFLVRTLIAALVAFAVTFVASLIIIPVLRRKKAGQHVREDGPKTHLVKEGTPTMGGVMIVIGLVASTLCCSVYTDMNAVLAMVFVLGATLGFGVIGFLDDAVKMFKKRSLGLRAWQKIVLQVAVAAAVACLSYFALGNDSEMIPFTAERWNLGWAYIPFTMFVFIAMVNSVNLTDGLDGLATGISISNSAAFVTIMLFMCMGTLSGGASMDNGVLNTLVFAAALLGSCAAFLCFNRHPAKVFMGDTGSFALGAALTAIAAALGMQILLPIMGFMFVLSSVSVILQVGSYKLRGGKRIFKMAPLHHHFELSGMPETKVVAGYVLISIVLSILAVCGAVLFSV